MDRMIPLFRISYDLDDRACNDLRALSINGREGYMHANSILGKMMKKRSKAELIGHPSNFVVSSVRKAWETIAKTGA